MIIIRCNTGKDIEVPVDELTGANLANLDLHRALLASADLRKSVLRKTILWREVRRSNGLAGLF
jgi:uncharacterized protein YjbI with pentapeptide repeats